MIAPLLTGIGSVSPFGVMAGPIPPRSVQPRTITAWSTSGPRRAWLVEPFRPADAVPGLKTRRLDRLSVWSLVASCLAVKDAGLDLDRLNRSRAAVVFATGLGCIELTEAYFHSAAKNGWAMVDPILFPETLGSAPASHVARHLDLRGPNITAACKGLGAECALLQAASLIRNGQAVCALVLAGETLTRSVYEWYEAAGVLAPACYEAAAEGGPGIIPGEGVVAVVLESPSHRPNPPARVYARVLSGHVAGGQTRQGLPREVSPLATNPVAQGMGDGGGLLRLALALGAEPGGLPAPGAQPAGRLACLASSAVNGASASLLLELA
jgi:3-oxoacyl-[acyl-carrier-protein] synthase II